MTAVTTDVVTTSIRIWQRALIAVATETACWMMALATAGSLLQIAELFQRNPFGWAEVGVLGTAVLCAFSCWGFFRLVADLLRPGGIAGRHAGELAWWLTGGVWVAACLGGLAVEGSGRGYAVLTIVLLGTLMAGPIVAVLLVACLRRRERERAHWRAWVGFGVGCTVPVPWMLLSWVIQP